MTVQGFPQNSGYLFGHPHNKDYRILGSLLGSTYILGNHHSWRERKPHSKDFAHSSGPLWKFVYIGVTICAYIRILEKKMEPLFRAEAVILGYWKRKWNYYLGFKLLYWDTGKENGTII